MKNSPILHEKKIQTIQTNIEAHVELRKIVSAVDDTLFHITASQSVFDTSKQSMSVQGTSHVSSCIENKSSVIADTELSKLQNRSRVLDNLIKNTQQRQVQRNLIKKSDTHNRDFTINDTKQSMILNDPTLRVEESLDIEQYHVVGVPPNPYMKSDHGEEDTPRRDHPTPEPISGKTKNLQKYRDNIIEKKREQKISSYIKGSYRVNGDTWEVRKKPEAILIHQDFADDKDGERASKAKHNDQKKTDVQIKYPFRKEKSPLIRARSKYSIDDTINIKTQKSSSKIERDFEQLKSSRTYDLAQSRNLAGCQNNRITKNPVNCKSFSKLRQPTPTHSSGRKSLDQVKSNLMDNHYKTMKSGAKSTRAAKSKLKENTGFSATQWHTTRAVTGPKTPTQARGGVRMTSKEMVQKRFRF